MLYYLFNYLHSHFNVPGTGAFQYITFRAGLAIILSLAISLVYGKRLINILRSIKDPYPYIRGLIFELGFKVDFVDFNQPVRQSGISKNNFYTLFDMGLVGIVKHSNILLRLMILFGFFLGVVSLLISISFFFYKILFWDSFQLGLAPILVGFFGLTAIQIMTIGLIGEYVSTVLTYSKNLPLVIEKERINF